MRQECTDQLLPRITRIPDGGDYTLNFEIPTKLSLGKYIPL
jgi:hypothetical protein